MATVTIAFTVTAVLSCSKKAAKAFNDSGDEDGFQKKIEAAETFFQRLPGAESVDVDYSVEEADDDES